MKRLTSLLVVLVLCAMLAQPALTGPPLGNEYVRRAGPSLRLHGRVFRFAGTNNYYLMYKSQFMVDDVLTQAAAHGFKVLRTWGSLDIGNEDGSDSVHGKADGVYFQYWDGTKPAYNDGPDGLERLDYVIFKAGQLGIKLVIPFVNNWSDFGGMDQYVRWRGGAYHDDFYSDPVIRQWYKDWISHVLNRTNIYTGLQYKDDPTIMMWELANEPRCKGSGVYPQSPSCTTHTLVEWADDVSTFIKSIDNRHLVSVGDEGFYCIPDARDWTENCGEGVDTIAFTKLENIDVMSFHAYPDHWGKSAAWTTAWIERHIADARALDKPAYLGEFGWRTRDTRNPVFRTWIDTVFSRGGAGAMYWILSGLQDDGSLYPDYDGFTVYCPSPVCTTMANFGRMMDTGQALVFPPVADHDRAVTPYETPVMLTPLANDTTYGGATLVPESLDLDPATPERQTTVTVYGGTFTWHEDGGVAFEPAAGFSGQAQATYTVMDSAGRLSNEAELVVVVLPSPTGKLTLFSFETGTEGWGPASWEPYGTVEQTTAFATDGSYGLKLNVEQQGWYGHIFSEPRDLIGKTRLMYDLRTTTAGTSAELALQVGPSWTWVQAGLWSWTGAGQDRTLEFDLTGAAFSDADLGDIRAIYLWFHAGEFYLDYIRAE
jgi:mannan endo-1,4-beta-mannosidase